MILVDTGPLVALYNAADSEHRSCVAILKTLQEPLYSTLPVLTEAFHILEPGSRNANLLCQFIEKKGLKIGYMDDIRLQRALELMQKYADNPMDFADASLLVIAEQLKIEKVFTLDRNDFNSYRIRSGHHYHKLKLILPKSL